MRTFVVTVCMGAACLNGLVGSYVICWLLVGCAIMNLENEVFSAIFRKALEYSAIKNNVVPSTFASVLSFTLYSAFLIVLWPLAVRTAMKYRYLVK